MTLVDADRSGEINYTEWITATINKREILSEERLEVAFALFDRVNLDF
jgi:calcium-dependent protein kinase